MMEEAYETGEGILHHAEGVDLMPGNIELSAIEVSLVNTMSRETVLRTYINTVKDKYDYVLIDCMPSLGNDDHQRPCRRGQCNYPRSGPLPARQRNDTAFADHCQSKAANQSQADH